VVTRFVKEGESTDTGLRCKGRGGRKKLCGPRAGLRTGQRTGRGDNVAYYAAEEKSRVINVTS